MTEKIRINCRVLCFSNLLDHPSNQIPHLFERLILFIGRTPFSPLVNETFLRIRVPRQIHEKKRPEAQTCENLNVKMSDLQPVSNSKVLAT